MTSAARGTRAILLLLLRSFSEVFSRDEGGLPRSWGPRADVPGAAAEARAASARLLALLAVMRLDVPAPAVATVEASICSLATQHVRLRVSGMPVSDASERTLLHSATISTCLQTLFDSPIHTVREGNNLSTSLPTHHQRLPQDRVSRSSGTASMASSLDGGRRSSTADVGNLDMLSLTEWPGVPPAAVLLPPGQCRSLWRQFVSDSNFIVQQVCCKHQLPPAGLWQASSVQRASVMQQVCADQLDGQHSTGLVVSCW